MSIHLACMLNEFPCMAIHLACLLNEFPCMAIHLACMLNSAFVQEQPSIIKVFKELTLTISKCLYGHCKNSMPARMAPVRNAGFYRCCDSGNSMSSYGLVSTDKHPTLINAFARKGSARKWPCKRHTLGLYYCRMAPLGDQCFLCSFRLTWKGRRYLF